MVSIPDPLKGHLPFAFIQPTNPTANLPATPPTSLFSEVNAFVRKDIGAIASLGGMIQGNSIIPKTRSGKTLRRLLRELLENAVTLGKEGLRKEVNVPPTIEDVAVVERARAVVEAWWKEKQGGKAKL